MPLQRSFWLLCLFGACCLLPLAPVRAASSGDSGQIDVNFFYDTLKDQGSWFNTTDYGDVWQPYIAYKSDSWRPYTDGYWSYTDGGWMFVSNESFGWAVYHYGRWTKLQDIGWAWVPGTEWAPAWVTWRESKPADANGATADGAPVSATTTDAPGSKETPSASAPAPAGAPAPPAGESESYIGWAPLPPTPIAYGTDYGYGPGVDVEVGIDPYAYVFTGYRTFGDPWLAGVIFGSDRGYYCCDHSVNITNVYYNRRGGYRGFYNGGPDFNRLRGVTARPIQQLSIQRNTNSALVRQQVRNGTFNNINGSRINVAAPRFSQNSVRNGRVNFSRRGTLPVTPVARQFAPASTAENPAYKQARESFNRQGEAYRAQRGNASAGAGNNREAAIATTPRARQEERQARQEAEHAGRSGGDSSPEAAAHPEGQPGPQAGQSSQAHNNQAARQGRRESRRTRGGGGGGAERAARAPRQSAGPRVSGGGGGRHGGGGGGRHEGGGGGGHREGGGGGGEHRGGGKGKKS